MNDFSLGPMGLIGASLLANQDGNIGQGLLQGLALNEQMQERRAKQEALRAATALKAQEMQREQLLREYLESAGADPRGILARGGTPDMARAYMEAPNMGRAKVSTYKQMRLPSGQVVEVPMTEYGDTAGTGFTPYEKPMMQDLGGATAAIDPLTLGVLQRFQKTRSPDSLAVDARGGSVNPFYQFIPTPQGIAVGDARTGTLSLGAIDGKPVQRAEQDPRLQGEIAAAKASGKLTGERSAESSVDMPKTYDKAKEAIRLVDELIGSKDGTIQEHPGFSQAVGGSSMLRIQNIPGTQARSFMQRLNQIKGKQFLEAFQGLKGGGQITEAEGQKATEAMARMDNSISEEEFKVAARDFQDVIRAGVERQAKKAALVPELFPAGTELPGGFRVRSVR